MKGVRLVEYQGVMGGELGGPAAGADDGTRAVIFQFRNPETGALTTPLAMTLAQARKFRFGLDEAIAAESRKEGRDGEGDG